MRHGSSGHEGSRIQELIGSMEGVFGHRSLIRVEAKDKYLMERDSLSRNGSSTVSTSKGSRNQILVHIFQFRVQIEIFVIASAQ